MTANRLSERESTLPIAALSFEVPRIEVAILTENRSPTERRAVVDSELLRIGAHQSNDIVLEDPSVSRFHCRLVRNNRTWSITDTGSRNGTFIQGMRVRDVDLSFPDTTIHLGSSSLRVRELGSNRSETLSEALSLGSLYGQSTCMRRLFQVIRRVGKTDVPVLIEGETGTGKELVAGELVRASSRKKAPFVVVDCGAIPANLIESELFGHARGSFTGAHQARMGAFEAAHGGTIFLDEIGELPLEIQPKLLRVLAQKEIRRLGENHTKEVDVRIIAATNRELEREVNEGRFREDLYYRLAVVNLRVPALRERPDDIPLLIQHFLSEMQEMDKMSLFDKGSLANLANHRWPGNIRELRNFVERMVYAGPELHNSPPQPKPANSPSVEIDIELPFKLAKRQIVDQFEEEYCRKLVAWAKGNMSKAARKAELDRMYINRMTIRHGISTKRA